MSKQKIDYIFVIVCLVLIIFLFSIFNNSSGLFEKAILTFFIYFLVVLFLSALNQIYYTLALEKVVNLLCKPIVLIFHINHLTSFMLPVLTFILFYFAPTLVLQLINEYFNIDFLYSDGLLYLVNVLTVLLYAYYGDKIMNYSFELFEVDVFKEKILTFAMTKRLIRIYAYSIMILIYAMYNYSTFNNKSEIFGQSLENFNVIKEVFVTFVAVDTLIQIIKTKANSQHNMINEEDEKTSSKSIV